jgi:hypothetical protein
VAVVREPPFGEDLNPEAEKEPLLEAVTRQLLVKTRIDLACVLAICKVRKLAMALQLRVIMSCVLKRSINPISNPKPRRQSLKIVTILLERNINKNEMAGICSTAGPRSGFQPRRRLH